MAEELKKRSEVEQINKWAVEDIYANEELWEKDFAKISELTDELVKFRGKLGESADTLYAFLKKNDELDALVEDVYCYASLNHDTDTADSKYQAMYVRVSKALTELSAKLSFTDAEMVAVPEETYEKFYAQKPELEEYKLMITRMLRQKAHVLSPECEQILAAAGDMAGVPRDAFSMLNNADLKFPIIKGENGEEIRITHGNYIRLLESKNREVRKQAFEGLYSVYAAHINTMASLFTGQFNKLSFYAKQRHYESALEASLTPNEIPVSVYKNLIATVHENMHLMHRYMALRKKMLGLSELHMYDINTPLLEDVDVPVPFEEAKKMVYAALEPMGEEYRGILKQGFDHRWIDVYENAGKRSGAYSMGVPVHPFVLLNYNENLDNAYTLAHEMGHALHSWYSNKTQPTAYRSYKLFVAEVASTCNEALLTQHLLKNTTDKKQRMYLINHAMDDFRTTLYRQAMFAEFEMTVSEQMEKGEAFTADSLCELYHKLNEEYYGKDVVIDHDLDYEWARIPHFYMGFYVYQYATGYSAAMALSNKILNGGESAVQDYIKFLKGGCSTDPISLLKIAGVDMSTPQPISEALKIFEAYIDEMEKLIEE